ncbi:MAG: hypothetical protein Q9227_002827 [Pyrenula ochraceoflavens]
MSTKKSEHLFRETESTMVSAIANDRGNEGGCDDALWQYCPSLAPSLVFAFLFAASAIIHLIQAVLHKKPFSWVIIMGALWEMVGYGFRSASVLDQTDKTRFTYQSIFILLAPLWVNAFAYMSLGRMVHMFLGPNEIDRHVLKVPAQKFTLIFVTLDIVAFVVQGIGGVMASNQSNSESTIMLGFHIYEGGVGFQQAVILGFSTMAVRLHIKLRQVEARFTDPILAPKRARWLLYAIYVALIMISLRIVTNIIKDEAKDNPLRTHEWPAFAFDAVPMFIAILAFIVVHPGRILRGPMSQFPKGREKQLAKMELKEAKRQGKQERQAAREKIDNARFMFPPSQGSFYP